MSYQWINNNNRAYISLQAQTWITYNNKNNNIEQITFKYTDLQLCFTSVDVVTGLVEFLQLSLKEKDGQINNKANGKKGEAIPSVEF